MWKDKVFAIQAKAHWLERCSTNLCVNINWWLHLLCPFSFIQLVLKVKQHVDASFCWVCHGRFHGVLPKEHPGAFYDVPWGLYKEMPANNHGQSDIASQTTDVRKKEYRNCCKRTFLHNHTKRSCCIGPRGLYHKTYYVRNLQFL